MRLILMSLLSIASLLSLSSNAAEPSIIPKPESMTVKEGVFALHPERYT